MTEGSLKEYLTFWLCVMQKYLILLMFVVGLAV